MVEFFLKKVSAVSSLKCLLNIKNTLLHLIFSFYSYETVEMSLLLEMSHIMSTRNGEVKLKLA